MELVGSMLKVSNLMHNQIVGQHVVHIANFFMVAKRYPGGYNNG